MDYEFQYGGNHYKISVALHDILENGHRLKVDGGVFELALYFVTNPAIVLTKDKILADVWKDRSVDENIIAVRVRYLRKALHDDETKKLIENRHGIGYIFNATVEKTPAESVAPEIGSAGDSTAVQEEVSRPRRGRGVMIVARTFAIIIGTVLWIFLIYGSISYFWPKVQKPPVDGTKVDGCTLFTTIESRIVSRWYTEGASLKWLTPRSQELFEEWDINLSADRDISKVSVGMEIIQPNDQVRLTPADAFLSDLQPRWFSGFTESGREPDYYARTVEFKNLTRGKEARVEVRRPIIQDMEVNPIHVVSLDGKPCTAQLPQPNDLADEKRLTYQYSALLNWKNGKKKLPLRLESGSKLPPRAVEFSVEARCANDECNRLFIKPVDGLRTNNQTTRLFPK